ncbi:MAG: DMT family transporter [Clostridia bacterium]|nr:DMT family transporter [Clostridia bacterium]MBQ4620450.1 DMT family transporter [Clostridia bacterium]
MPKKKFAIPGSVILLLAALAWGSAFVAQSLGSDSVRPFTFNAARSLLGALVLVPVFLTFDRVNKKPKKSGGKTLLIGGILCGVLLFMACNLQQFAISYVDTAGKTAEELETIEKANIGKVAFLTALYIVLVPVFGVFMKKKAGVQVWLGVLIALIGMYFLSIKPGFTISGGDIYAFLCAFAFALQIIVVDEVVDKVDPIRLSCLQFLVCGILSSVCAAIFDKPALSDILNAWAPILYMGVVSSGIAYTLQIIGQSRCNSVVASLVMSMESVFSALFGFLILHQAMLGREIAGCVLMLFAIVLAQIPGKKEKV